MATPIYHTSSITSLPKYLAHAVSKLETGGSVEFVQGLTSGTPEILTVNHTNTNNRKSLNSLRNMQERATKAQLDTATYKEILKKIPIEVEEDLGWDPHAGNIMKSGDKIPFGYLAEILLQAAITARFVHRRSKNEAVSTKDVAKTIRQFILNKSQASAESAVKLSRGNKKSVAKAFEFDVENEKRGVGKDKVYSLYVLNDTAYRWLSSKVKTLETDAQLKPYITDAIQYVNSGACREHANYFYTNGRVDRIDILSLGISGQGETKADIRTQYWEGWTGGNVGTPHKMSLNLSVKINQVTQVGQISGIDGTTYERLCAAVGVTLPKTTKLAIDKLSVQLPNKKNDSVIQGKIYKLVYDKLKTAKNVEDIFNGIEHFIALKEAKSLTIVDIGKGLQTYFVKNLKAMRKSLAKKPITTQVRTTGSGNYVMMIRIGGQDLMQISSRYTGGVYRNFIETGELLRTVLSSEL